jgi:lipid-binding SYLF domain-containing protein
LDLENTTAKAIDAFKANDRSKSFFDSAYAWAVFPKITKGAVGLGIADGRGQVYQGGELVGWAKLTSVTVGAQIGGQDFSEIIFFRNRFAFDKFKAGGLKGQAGTGAVSGKEGGTNLADYSDGVAIFTLNNNGLIVSADIGAQSIHFASVN